MATLRSRTALVVTVVPWTTRSRSAGVIPVAAIAATTPTAWLGKVVGTFARRTSSSG